MRYLNVLLILGRMVLIGEIIVSVPWPFSGCVCVCVSVYVCVGGVTVACGLCPKSRGKLVSFSDTLLVVSILDIVYDCHLRSLLQS